MRNVGVMRAYYNNYSNVFKSSNDKYYYSGTVVLKLASYCIAKLVLATTTSVYTSSGLGLVQ